MNQFMKESSLDSNILFNVLVTVYVLFKSRVLWEEEKVNKTEN